MKTKLSIGLLLAAMTVSSWGASLQGVVVDDKNQHMAGVMVRITDPVSGMSEAVYSDQSGRYHLQTALQGELTLRLRTPYYQDLTQTLSLSATAEMTKNMAMSPMTDPAQISDTLPAGFHFGSLPFEKGRDADFSRLQFQRDCLSCHQLGNRFTRKKRTPESWAQTIARMHLYLGNFDMELRDERSVILSEGLGGEPLKLRPEFPIDEAIFSAKLYEYRLEQGGVPHDAIFNPDDGLLYTVDQMLDHMAITDPATGITEYVKQKGGAAMSVAAGYSKQNPVIGEFDPGARHGPHSLAMGKDGKYYVTNTGTRSIGVFNPKTRAWEASHLMAEETKAVYPHTIRVNERGEVWFTLTGSEQVGRLVPETGEFTIITLPTHKPHGIAGTTQPYGIDIHPGDDATWYGRLFADKIGRIDPVTLEVTEFDSPVSGPRRMHFDDQGILWVTGYSEGMLAKIDPDGFTSIVYKMPELIEGFRPAPYALGVHPDTQDIWVNENMTDRIYRFIPSEERWVLYPVPLQGTYTRDMTFTDEGRVCTSNNPLPAAALEGGVLEVLCIDPENSTAPSSALAVSQR
jgi:streptogramin lyase